MKRGCAANLANYSSFARVAETAFVEVTAFNFQIKLHLELQKLCFTTQIKAL